MPKAPKESGQRKLTLQERGVLARAAKQEKTDQREWIFFQEWKRTGNKAKAALRAGYCADNPENASAMGCEVLKRDRVQAWVREYEAEIKEKYSVTEQSLVAEAAKLAYAGM